MRNIVMNMSDDSRKPEFGLPAPLFASSWVALLLVIRKELSNFIPGEDEQRGKTEKQEDTPLN